MHMVDAETLPAYCRRQMERSNGGAAIAARGPMPRLRRVRSVAMLTLHRRSRDQAVRLFVGGRYGLCLAANPRVRLRGAARLCSQKSEMALFRHRSPPP